MIAALLSGAWWAQRLSGPVMQALGIAAAVLAGVVVVGLGLAWLRADARSDEAAAWERKLTAAQIAAEQETLQRVQAAEVIATQHQAEREKRHAEEKGQLEELLAAASTAQPASAADPRRCYSPEMIRRLNKL
jgi:altronate dehydratase